MAYLQFCLLWISARLVLNGGKQILPHSTSFGLIQSSIYVRWQKVKLFVFVQTGQAKIKNLNHRGVKYGRAKIMGSKGPQVKKSRGQNAQESKGPEVKSSSGIKIQMSKELKVKLFHSMNFHGIERSRCQKTMEPKGVEVKHSKVSKFKISRTKNVANGRIFKHLGVKTCNKFMFQTCQTDFIFCMFFSRRVFLLRKNARL